MTSPPTTVFLERREASEEPHLERARVIGAAGECLTVSLDGPAPVGDVQVYYEDRGRFVRRAASAVARENAAGGTDVDLNLVGPPVLAERRSGARVSYLDVYSQLVRELAPAGISY